MTAHLAQLAAKIEGSTVTDDGHVFVLRLAMADGTENLIAFPRDQVPNLAELAALGIAQSDKILKVAPEAKGAFTVSWWTLGRDQKTGQVVLSLTFGAGGRLGFLLPNPMPEHIHETLGVMLEKSTPEKPGTPLV